MRHIPNSSLSESTSKYSDDTLYKRRDSQSLKEMPTPYLGVGDYPFGAICWNQSNSDSVRTQQTEYGESSDEWILHHEPRQGRTRLEKRQAHTNR